MKSKDSIIWLIILLGTVVFGLAWVVGYNQHLKQVSQLNEEITRLKQEVKGLQQEKSGVVLPLPSASILPKSDELLTTPSAKLKENIATGSGEKE